MKNKIKAFFAKDGTKSILSSLLCIAAGIFVGWLVLLILALTSDKIPVSHAFKGLGIILAGPFASGGAKNIAFVLGDMLFEAAPLMLTVFRLPLRLKRDFSISAHRVSTSWVLWARLSWHFPFPLLRKLQFSCGCLPCWSAWSAACFGA